MYDVMVSCYMLNTRIYGVPLVNRPFLEYTAAETPSYLTRY